MSGAQGFSNGAVIFATLLGPILAVVVTRVMDWMREAATRKRWLFSTMLSLRGQHLRDEHVRALNLVQLEFAADKDVLTAWREFISHTETTRDATNDQAIQVWHTAYKAKLDQLLVDMAKAVKMVGRPIDLSRGGYYPEAWNEQQRRQEAAQDFIAALSEGKKAVPVLVFQGDQPGGTTGGTP